MPSPAIATTAPRDCRSRTTSAFCAGQHLRVDVGGREAELGADGLRGVARVTREHHDAQPLGAERVERLARASP